MADIIDFPTHRRWRSRDELIDEMVERLPRPEAVTDDEFRGIVTRVVEGVPEPPQRHIGLPVGHDADRDAIQQKLDKLVMHYENAWIARCIDLLAEQLAAMK